MKKKIFFILMIGVIMAGCSNHPSLPTDFSKETSELKIFPDYKDVTIPYNIAPLNFKVLNRGTSVIAKLQTEVV
jgi:hypothetical protein